MTKKSLDKNKVRGGGDKTAQATERGRAKTNRSKASHRSRSTCPVTFALDLIGDKWSLLIIRDLLFKNKKHYGEFLTSAERISTNILADRLVKLDSAGIISKSANSTNAKQHNYHLTQKGKDLLPLMLEMIQWSAKHDGRIASEDNIIDGAPRKLLKRARTDRDGLLAEILGGLK